jgi:ATP-dependent helicase/nuclease subunit A
MSAVIAQAQEQQRAAADPAAHVFVEANAGSGKTRVLVDRVTRLLLGGAAPDRILCLTYTKAAAGEMKNRLFKRLGAWAVTPDEALREELAELGVGASPDLAAARRLFARALETPGGLQIQTIHAFCERLIRRFPLEAGAPPGFEVADDGAAKAASDTARETLLLAAAAEPEIARALEQITGRGAVALDTLLGAVSGGRHVIRRALQKGGAEAAADRSRGQLGLGADETPGALKADFLETLDREALAGLRDVLLASGKNDQKQAARISLLLEAGDPESAWAAALGLVFTDQHKPRANRGIAKGPREAHPVLFAAFERFAETVEQMQERLNAALLAQDSAAALVLAVIWIAAYETALARASRLDFSDLIEKARDLLTRSEAAEWVRYKLDGGVDHILVDEAQDTAPEQWELIAALAEEFFAGEGAADGRPRTVFCVGDEKQSIYSFQGADPARFIAEGERLEKRAAEARSPFAKPAMEVSFRSAAEVLDAVDHAFAEEGEAFAREETADDPAAPFQRYRGHRAERASSPGSVEVWPAVEVPDKVEETDPLAPVDKERADSSRNQLAALLADEIRGMIDRGEAVWRETRTAEGRGWEAAPMTAGDIIVLVRKRGPFFDELIRQLKRRDVPVAGADRMVLREQLAVEDLISLLRFLACPEDDLSLAELLTAPFFHPEGQAAPVSDDKLFELAHGRHGPLWNRVRPNGDPAFIEAAHVLGELLARADLETPYALLSGFLGARTATGETRMARLMARLGEEARDPVEEFLAAALDHERKGAPSLARFLAEAEAEAGQVKREMEAASGKVRVMTVHASKGLEAPVVILPDTTQFPAARGGDGLFLDEDLGLLWSPGRNAEPAPCALRRAEAEARTEAEYLRLLYVALTRAADRLIVCGWKHGRAPGRIDAKSWHARLTARWSAAEQAREIETPAGAGWRLGADPVLLGKSAESEKVGESVPDWVRRSPPEETAPPRPVAPSRMLAGEEAEPPAASPVAAGAQDRFRRGEIIHKLLQTLPDLAAGKRRDAADRYLAAQAEIDDDQAARLVEEVFAILDAPAFAGLFGPGSRAEVGLSGWAPGLPEGALAHGQVDRLVINNHEVLIADYKTNRPPPAREEDVPAAYLSQMAVYRALLQAMHPQKRIRCAIIWTDSATWMELSDDRLRERLNVEGA